MEAYLDNSATTRVSQPVRELCDRLMTEEFGNPSSAHLVGVHAENYIKQARSRIAATLKAKEDEIFFTSGGTESNNWALIGTALKKQRSGKHIITSAIEHPSVHQPLLFLQELGYEITFLPVDESGHVSVEDLRSALRPDTILVSIMYVNNELGAVEPIGEIGRVIAEHNRESAVKTVFHVDAIQAYGKFRIRPKTLGVDLLSVSGHKLHAPKGTGFLYVKSGTKLQPILMGGGQQKGMRSGTDNVPGWAALGLACELAYTDFDEKIAHIRAMKEKLFDGLSAMEGTHLNSSRDEGAPQIVSCAFEGVRSEVLLHALEEKGVYVSAGSACSTNKKLPVSSVLEEIHLERSLAEGTLRFSLCEETAEEEIDWALSAVGELLPVLRKYTRR